MIKKRINQNGKIEYESSSEIEKEIWLKLMDIKSYSESALYCLKSDDLTYIDKDEVIAYFSTVPKMCEEIELRMYDLELAVGLESNNHGE